MTYIIQVHCLLYFHYCQKAEKYLHKLQIGNTDKTIDDTSDGMRQQNISTKTQIPFPIGRLTLQSSSFGFPTRIPPRTSIGTKQWCPLQDQI